MSGASLHSEECVPDVSVKHPIPFCLREYVSNPVPSLGGSHKSAI